MTTAVGGHCQRQQISPGAWRPVDNVRPPQRRRSTRQWPVTIPDGLAINSMHSNGMAMVGNVSTNDNGDCAQVYNLLACIQINKSPCHR